MATHRPTRSWRKASDVQPPHPKAGLPIQRTPRWLALGCKLLVFPFMLLDLLVQGLIHRLSPPPYELKGQCKMRGHCCHYILMEWPPIMDRWPWMGRFWMWWYTDIHGFFQRGFDLEDEQDRVAKVMGCRHLQPDGTCGSYRLRPAICRQWPRIEYAHRPHLLKGCGFYAVSRDPEVFGDETSEATNPPDTSSIPDNAATAAGKSDASHTPAPLTPDAPPKQPFEPPEAPSSSGL